MKINTFFHVKNRQMKNIPVGTTCVYNASIVHNVVFSQQSLDLMWQPCLRYASKSFLQQSLHCAHHYTCTCVYGKVTLISFHMVFVCVVVGHRTYCVYAYTFTSKCFAHTHIHELRHRQCV